MKQKILIKQKIESVLSQVYSTVINLLISKYPNIEKFSKWTQKIWGKRSKNKRSNKTVLKT